MSFDTNVFVNCPFDRRYRRLLEPMLFTCIYAGLNPRLSQLGDSGTARIGEIIRLIKTSKYSIHDLSRMKSSKPNQLARFNMPFELGLDLGVRAIGKGRIKRKKCLILDEEKYRYQAALSDLGGSDIASYGSENQAQKLIKSLRDWFVIVIGPNQASSRVIHFEYTEFLTDLQEKLLKLGFERMDILNLTVTEYIHYAKEWINSRASRL